MPGTTKIEWADSVWNVVTGCDQISPGCDHCYAKRFAERFRGVPGNPYEQGFDLRLWPDRLSIAGTWRKPKRIFVNSMSDLFHKEVPRDFLDQVFGVMEQVSRHTYLVLTKRSSLLRDYVNARYGTEGAPAHIWLGVSVEDQERRVRIDHLQETHAAVRFLSCEPLLESLGRPDLCGIHWVIAGGESGPGFRPVQPTWVRELRDQCVEKRIAFFFKQWGGLHPKAGGNELDGTTWTQFPAVDDNKGQRSGGGTRAEPGE